MKIIIVLGLALIIFVVGVQPGTAEFFTEPIAAAESAEKMITVPTPVVEPHTEPLTTSEHTDIAVAMSAPVEPTPVASPLSNEDVVWNALIAAGYSREQTAGIMGNLMQEHRFRTDGDGLAQWIGNRKANLEARDNSADINVQVQFLIDELRGPEIKAHNSIVANNSVENAVIAFQNQFERCDPVHCMQNQRIQYAYEILARH